jgi:hypothetical protein
VNARAQPLALGRSCGILSPMPARWIAVAAALAALAAVPASSAQEQPAERPERLPDHATIAGVHVGGLGPRGAERAVRTALAPVWEAPLHVRAPGLRRTLRPAEAGARVDYDWMVDAAFRLAAEGRYVSVPFDVDVDPDRLTAATRRIAAGYRRAGRNARVRFGIRQVVRIRHRTGRALDARALRRALLRELLRATPPDRVVRARRVRVLPPITTGDLRRIHHTYVSVDRRTFTLRLFKRLRVAHVYRVAIGAAGYETPRGMRRVLEKQVNPAWHAPNRPWAGEYAGRTIPPGDPRNPLKARWLGLGGGVGIHGTAEEWSIGTRASHGCIRMRVRDVKHLYPRVPVGTPVLIR